MRKGMCLVEVLFKDKSCGKDEWRMCLAELPSRISSSGRICLAECLQGSDMQKGCV